jgi:uncharacterized protein
VATLGLWGEAIVLGVVLWMASSGSKRARIVAAQIRANPEDPLPQLRLYKRAIVRLWAFAFATIACMTASGHPIALAIRSVAGFATVIGLGTVAVILPVVLIYRRPKMRDRLGSALGKLREGWVLFPRSAAAARWFILLAVTAGVAEELVFRGMVPALVAQLTGSRIWLPWLLSSVLFGLGHGYQGPRGTLLTGALGAGFYAFVLQTGSLLSAMIVHAMIDLRVAAMYPIIRNLPIPPPPTPG